jgi:hypothetical protein
MQVTSATGFTPIVVQDTSASGIAMLRLFTSAVKSQLFASSTTAIIQTNTEHRILLKANTSNSTTIGITVNTDNTVKFGGSVTFADGSTNVSDASLKTPDPPEANIQHSLNMLKTVSARTYERTDKPGTGIRIGFIAQEVQASLPTEFANLVGSTQHTTSPEEEPTEILTVDYARLVAPLWQCCKNLLSRI